MKIGNLFLSLAVGMGLSLAAHANYNVTVPTNNCTWITTGTGSAPAGVQGQSVTWKNESLNCPDHGDVIKKSSARYNTGQTTCSLTGLSKYKVSGNCSSFSVYYTVIVPDTRPTEGACTYSTQSSGSAGSGSIIAYFYQPIGQCQTYMVKQYENGHYVRTSYSPLR